MDLRMIQPADHGLLREIYADAIETQALSLYSPEQMRAWRAMAWLPGVLDRTLQNGVGWISGSDDAFAVRYPADRLALLYCRGCSARQGHASALLEQIEGDAFQSGLDRLKTEASAFSRPLLERRGWRWIATENILIGGVSFERYRMEIVLSQALS